MVLQAKVHIDIATSSFFEPQVVDRFVAIPAKDCACRPTDSPPSTVHQPLAPRSFPFLVNPATMLSPLCVRRHFCSPLESLRLPRSA